MSVLSDSVVQLGSTFSGGLGSQNLTTTGYVQTQEIRVPASPGTLTITNSSGTACAVFTASTQSLKFVDAGGTVSTPSGGATIGAGATVNGNAGTGTMVAHGSNYAVHRFGPKGQGTIGSQNATGGMDRFYLSTTDATVTVIASVKVQAGSSTQLHGMVNGRNTSTGATVYAFIRMACAKNVGGTTSLVGTPVVDIDVTDIATAAVTITANDSTDIIEVKVTGVAATNIDWQADISWHDN